MTIESAGKKYWKTHYEQARILEAEGIDLDVDGYPLASEEWIYNNLNGVTYRKWVTLERIKDSIMKKIMKEIS
jgi:hypothetical protein